MAVAHYFIGPRYLGRSTIPPTTEPLSSLAWMCESCGELWARVVIEGALWAVEHNRCEKCGPAGAWDNRAAGSLLRQWYFTSEYLMGRSQAMALENLPREALAREFKIALAWRQRIDSKSTETQQLELA